MEQIIKTMEEKKKRVNESVKIMCKGDAIALEMLGCSVDDFNKNLGVGGCAWREDLPPFLKYADGRPSKFAHHEPTTREFSECYHKLLIAYVKLKKLE